jgi:hypothetical protein
MHFFILNDLIHDELKFFQLAYRVFSFSFRRQSFRVFLEQFQSEVASAMSALHKKSKANAKELEQALRLEMQNRVQGTARNC